MAPMGGEHPNGTWDPPTVGTSTHLLCLDGLYTDWGDEPAPNKMYEVRRDAWQVLPERGAPAGVYAAAVVWADTELLVWGGSLDAEPGGGPTNEGARFDPRLQTWRPMSTINAPTPMGGPGSVWTGRWLFVWGGIDAANNFRPEGGLYDPVRDEWRTVSRDGAPLERAVAAWTGKK
ncbi:MAG TPA: hypothetical protein VFB62_20525, partial [Polyangiaceae bacterium]|nr:hypothetical protein [Polyangiaceae bacterium]